MAYISTEEVKAIRENLKKEFPRKDGWKLSVTKDDNSGVNISFMEAPVNLAADRSENYNVNHHWMEKHFADEPEKLAIFQRAEDCVTRVKKQVDYNAGDPYADYANVNFFYYIGVGKWNQNFKYNEPEIKENEEVEEKTELTEMEIAFMELALNYSDRETQLSDNYSNAGIAEGMEAFDWNAQQMGGLVSSLEKKGMGYMDSEGVNGQPVDIFWLTEKGVNTIFDIIEARTGSAPVEAKNEKMDETLKSVIIDSMSGNLPANEEPAAEKLSEEALFQKSRNREELRRYICEIAKEIRSACQVSTISDEAVIGYVNIKMAKFNLPEDLRKMLW